MNENYTSLPQPAYLLKIILGLLVVADLIVSAYELSVFGLSPLDRNLLLGALLVVSVAIVPIVRRVYVKMDELQKLQHQNASVASLPVIAAASAVIGIFQANDFMSEFNQFWVSGMVAGVWAINLMLADRRYR